MSAKPNREELGLRKKTPNENVRCNTSTKTGAWALTRAEYQREVYDDAYESNYGSAYGIPDRKIEHFGRLHQKRILSVGSGAAADIWYLADDNFIVALDYSDKGLAVASHHNIKGLVADLNSLKALPFQDSSFDVVICKDILEHLLDPLGLMKEVQRLLKPSGLGVLSVPNHFFLPMRLRILFGRGLTWSTLGIRHRKVFDDWNYMHIRFFTFKSFKRFISAASLEPRKWFWDFGGWGCRCSLSWDHPVFTSMGPPLVPRGEAVTILEPEMTACISFMTNSPRKEPL